MRGKHNDGMEIETIPFLTERESRTTAEIGCSPLLGNKQLGKETPIVSSAVQMCWHQETSYQQGELETDGNDSLTSTDTFSRNRMSDGSTMERTWISGVLFLMGSVFYLSLDCWDYYDVLVGDDTDDGDYDDDDCTIFVVGRKYYITRYMLLYAAAGACFLVDGVLLFLSTKRRARYQQMRRPMQPKNSDGVEADLSSTDEEESVISTSQSSSESTSDHLDVYLRNEAILDKYVACALAIGGALDVIAASFVELDEARSNRFNVVAAHFYLMEALIAVLGRRFILRDETFVMSAEGVGSVLFLLGSLIDVVLGYCFLVPGFAEDHALVIPSIVSSLLWVADSLIVFPSSCLLPQSRNRQNAILFVARQTA